jgi:acyl carrier protein
LVDTKQFLSELSSVINEDGRLLERTELLADLKGWDSLTLLNVIAFFDAFANVEVTAEEIGNCVSVDDLLQLVTSKSA